MTQRYSEEETISAIARLTRRQLTAFVDAEIVNPIHTEEGHYFRQADLVRMELLCELSEHFDLQDDALGVVISLIDQLHGVRGELRAVLDAVEAEPEDVRLRIGAAIKAIRRSG
ncbi:MAG: hypothetical protein OEY05_03085 [Paracoccaceae bacterium]|nr:hypothetical protein [Paracoccaceae bacterium]MDH5528997.1 hypothetical protein [Paracoccaceae bacterium]